MQLHASTQTLAWLVPGLLRRMTREGDMGEWKTVYEDEVEERWVTVKVYESEDDEDGDEDPVVRVTITPIDDVEGVLERSESLQTPVAEAKAADRSITLEPDPVEDLEEELIEIGFSPEAAAWIVRKVPE
jgi:hypothetical protein